MSEITSRTVPAEASWRLLGIGLLWLVATAAASFLAPFALALVLGFHNGLRPGQTSWQAGRVIYALLSLVALQLTLLVGALRRGKVVGRGDRAAGLGFHRLRRPALLSGLALLLLVSAIFWAYVLLRWFGGGLATSLETFSIAAQLSGPIEQAVLLVSVALLAPVCEELFFRGWLWTGLARRWPPMAVALATSLPWLVLHIADGGVRRPLFLIPAAIFLSLARQFCGGVAASLVLHVLNNSAATALLLIALATTPH